jgi:hypothetical protein
LPVPESEPETEPLCARTLDELQRPQFEPEKELLKHRFLCRGGGALIVGPTGVGKSVLNLQALLLWALGLPFFGIYPARPLKSLLIQAENDDGDIAEIRDGVCSGLGLSDSERSRALKAVHVFQESARTSTDFFAYTVAPLLEAHTPDLLVIDPALAYIGGESNSQRDVGGFLRNGLNPLLQKHQCGGLVVHHTNKPKTGQEKQDYSGSDFAYLGGGSTEWANWARGVIALRGMGSHEVFELRLAKRGARVGWRNDEGERLYAKLIGHAKEEGAICWREASEDELEEKAEKKTGRTKVYTPERLLAVLADEGMSYSAWLSAARDKEGFSKATFDRVRQVLLRDGRVFVSKLDGLIHRK